MMPIAPRVGARLIELNVDEGADVQRGQVLARLESSDLMQALHQLEAQQGFAKRDYDRYAAMPKQGIIARQIYDRARSDWQSAVAATERARAEAGFMTLTALDDGHVIRRDGEIGQLIAANQPIFWLAGRSAIRISADVDEEDVSKVVAGQNVLIRADAFPGQVFRGRVQSITPKGDSIARSYRVRIAFTERVPFMIGMTAETNIVVRTNDHALLVPASTVTAGKVWTIEDGALRQKSVRLGTAGINDIEIVSGLTMSDLVVVTPPSSLTVGAKARGVLRPFEP
jgi:RND family efflux transporter MFP subunit